MLWQLYTAYEHIQMIVTIQYLQCNVTVSRFQRLKILALCTGFKLANQVYMVGLQQMQLYYTVPALQTYTCL